MCLALLNFGIEGEDMVLLASCFLSPRGDGLALALHKAVIDMVALTC